MGFKKMLFKGKQVFVEVDSSGSVVEKGGRATMKYNIEDSRSYSPSLSNLVKEQGDNDEVFSMPSPIMPSTDTNRAKPSKASAAKAATKAPAGTIIAYTDGGCIGNPGPSGLGYVIRYPDNSVEKKGEPLGQGTNNIAELTGIFRVLQVVVDRNAPLHIHTDSSYAIGVLTKGWKAKANQQLIADMKKLLVKFTNVKLVKVKGHAGNPDNELVDTLANTAARTQKEQ